MRRISRVRRTRADGDSGEQPQGISGVHAQVPTKELADTSHWALGAVFVCQLALFDRREREQPLRAGLKPFLKAS